MSPSPSMASQSFNSVRARLESFAASGAVDQCDLYDFLCELIPEHIRLLPHDFEQAVQYATQHRRVQQIDDQAQATATASSAGKTTLDTSFTRPSIARLSSRDRISLAAASNALKFSPQQHAALLQPLFLTQEECRQIYGALLQKWKHRLSINTLSQAAYLSIYQPSRLLIALLTLMFWIFLPLIMIWALRNGFYKQQQSNANQSGAATTTTLPAAAASNRRRSSQDTQTKPQQQRSQQQRSTRRSTQINAASTTSTTNNQSLHLYSNSPSLSPPNTGHYQSLSQPNAPAPFASPMIGAISSTDYVMPDAAKRVAERLLLKRQQLNLRHAAAAASSSSRSKSKSPQSLDALAATKQLAEPLLNVRGTSYGAMLDSSDASRNRASPTRSGRLLNSVSAVAELILHRSRQSKHEQLSVSISPPQEQEEAEEAQHLLPDADLSRPAHRRQPSDFSLSPSDANEPTSASSATGPVQPQQTVTYCNTNNTSPSRTAVQLLPPSPGLLQNDHSHSDDSVAAEEIQENTVKQSSYYLNVEDSDQHEDEDDQNTSDDSASDSDYDSADEIVKLLLDEEVR